MIVADLRDGEDLPAGSKAITSSLLAPFSTRPVSCLLPMKDID